MSGPVKQARIKVVFTHGNSLQNGTCAECGHSILRHGINAYNDDGKIHCWDCIGFGGEECITKPLREASNVGE